MDNPEKLATVGTQDEEKQSKNTTQYMLDTAMRKTNINNVKIGHGLSYKQLDVKTNQTSLLCRNRKGHHNTELFRR